MPMHADKKKTESKRPNRVERVPNSRSGVSIKPGVERSGTPETRSLKYSKPAERAIDGWYRTACGSKRVNNSSFAGNDFGLSP